MGFQKGFQFLFLLVPLFLLGGKCTGQSLPEQPQDPAHPGSASYSYSFETRTLEWSGREINVWMPSGKSGEKFPIVFFGHGYRVPMFCYSTTFEHLAKKGIAVAYLSYDTGWSDNSDFERMGHDYQEEVNLVLRSYPAELDPAKVIYSGHSNGSYAALMAAGSPPSADNVVPAALVLFATAGYEEQYVARLAPRTIVTLVVGEDDDQTPPSLSRRIYDLASVPKKQLLVLKSYRNTSPEVVADHGFVRTFGWTGAIFTPLHYFGSWKLLVGAAQDLKDGSRGANPYVYGDQATSTGLQGFEHSLTRSW